MTLTRSTYPADWQLNDRDLKDLTEQLEDALGTTNGDTGLVSITARQLTLLLEAQKRAPYAPQEAA